VQLVLSAVLLSNVNFENTYVAVGTRYATYSGVAGFNESIMLDNGTNGQYGNDGITFVMYLRSFLSDPRISISAPVTTGFCDNASNNVCFSYVLPGEAVYLLYLQDEVPPPYWNLGVQNLERPSQSTAFIAPGYLLEYSLEQENFTFENSDCREYQTDILPSFPFKVCLQNTEKEVVSGKLQPPALG